MKIINPTKEKLEMQFEGTVYSVEAEDSTDVSEKVARHWKEAVHSFIVLETEEVKVAPVVIEKKEEKVTEEKSTPEVVKVEVKVEDKVKASTNKTNKK